MRRDCRPWRALGVVLIFGLSVWLAAATLVGPAGAARSTQEAPTSAHATAAAAAPATPSAGTLQSVASGTVTAVDMHTRGTVPLPEVLVPPGAATPTDPDHSSGGHATEGEDASEPAQRTLGSRAPPLAQLALAAPAASTPN